MSMEIDFRSILAADPDITALVSTRIYPATYPQGATSPAMRYQKITGGPGTHMQGSDGLSVNLMQVDLRVADASTAAKDAMTLRDAIVDTLHTFRGVKGGTDFRVISLRDDRGIQFEKTDTGSFYTASLDFDVTSRAA